MNQVTHVILRVAHDSRASALGIVIAGELQSGNTIELHAIGERAVYVMAKSLCVAQQALSQAGHSLACQPAFAKNRGQDGDRTEIRMMVVRERGEERQGEGVKG